MSMRSTMYSMLPPGNPVLTVMVSMCRAGRRRGRLRLSRAGLFASSIGKLQSDRDGSAATTNSRTQPQTARRSGRLQLGPNALAGTASGIQSRDRDRVMRGGARDPYVIREVCR
jgi:hypothetical protein